MSYTWTTKRPTPITARPVVGAIVWTEEDDRMAREGEIELCNRLMRQAQEEGCVETLAQAAWVRWGDHAPEVG